MKKLIIGYYNVANLITLSGGILSLLAIICALKGNLNLSMTLLIIAGLCDLFDGLVARKIKRTDESKAFGVQLDSLVDVLSFVVAPALIMHVAGLLNFFLACIYVVFGIVRLAYFNSVTANSEHKSKYYIGCPVTYMSLVLPLIYLSSFIFDKGATVIIISATFIVMSILFVLNIKIPKPTGVFYAVFPLLAVVVIAVYIFNGVAV